MGDLVREMGETMSEYDTENVPSTAISSTRYPMVKPYADNTPMLPARNTAQIIQQILATPAPVPQRQTEVVKRERLEGASEKSTPVMRAVASLIRSSKYLLIVAIVGVVAYVAIPSVNGFLVIFITLVAMAIVMLVFDAMEYRHSQSGVERLRTQVDHRLEALHEVNRHVETMTAISGDIEIKLEVLKIANGSRRLAEKRGE